jgi:Holliday junction DNA helicase RuvA
MLLISVSGVGPATARVMLSSLNSKELEMAIATENVALLQSVKGIGAKTAQRIIVDLRDKIKPGEDSEVVSFPMGTTFSGVVKEAVSALVMLGFSQNNSRKVVTKIVKEFPALSVEAVIKEALKRL